jgi:hypothetical protein
LKKNQVPVTIDETLTKAMANGRQEMVAQPEETLPAPQGIGMAVAFDWGLAIQILVTPVVTLLLGQPSFLKPLKLGAALTTTLSFALSLPFFALVAVFGEGVRRGWKWTRPVQLVFNTLGFIGGLFTLPSLWQSGKSGNFWPLVTSVILVIFSPIIAWRMSRRATGTWFANVTSASARKRHGGLWPVLIALWAIVGGVLQAIAASAR